MVFSNHPWSPRVTGQKSYISVVAGWLPWDLGRAVGMAGGRGGNGWWQQWEWLVGMAGGNGWTLCPSTGLWERSNKM